MKASKNRRLLDHVNMIIAAMFITFFFIDRFNEAMGFMSGTLSKWLLLVFSILVFLRSAFSIYAKRTHHPRQASEREHFSGRK